MEKTKKPRSPVARWVRRAFMLWAVFATLWLANSMRTQGVDAATLHGDATVAVIDDSRTLAFMPVSAATNRAALVFICGSGVAAEAYAPLLRPVSAAGHPVFIVRLPFRFALFESHRREAVDRVRDVMTAHPEFGRWVVAGHSQGGALACRAVRAYPKAFSAMVLLGTTHPKEEDFSALTLPVTKIYGSNDGVAKTNRMFANRSLLPATTHWVEVPGGNHSQFGHYGHQLLDGRATVTREEQQTVTRSAILDVLNQISN